MMGSGKMQNVFWVIMSFILYAVFDQIKMYDLAAQFMLIGFWRGLLEPVLHPRVQEEIVLIEYPEVRYRKKHRYYLGVGVKEEKEPVEFVWMERILTVLFVVFTVTLWVIKDDSREFGNSVTRLYGIMGIFVAIGFLNQVYKVAFTRNIKGSQKVTGDTVWG